MFGLAAARFRFGNVVGPRQTHGVGLRLRPPAARRPDAPAHPRRRHAEQVLRPRRRRHRRGAARAARGHATPFEVFNVATGDYITVHRDRRARRRGAGPRPAARRVRVHRRRPRLEGRRPDRPARDRADPRARLGESARSRARRCGESMARCCRRRRGRAAVTRTRRAGRLPRPRRRAQRARWSGTACRTRRATVDELELLPGVAEACRALRDAGLRPGRRHQPAGHRPRHARRAPSVDAIHERLRGALPLDDDRRLPARRRRRLRMPQAAAGHAPRRRRARSGSTSRAATWSATAGATSRPAGAPAAGRCFVDRGYLSARQRRADAVVAEPTRRGRVDPRRGPEMTGFDDRARGSRSSPTAPTCDSIVELCDRPARSRGFTTNPTLMRKAGRRPTTRRSRARCSSPSPTGRSRSRSSPTSSPRWSARPADRLLGRQRLRQDPRDEHARREPPAALVARAVRRRRAA